MDGTNAQWQQWAERAAAQFYSFPEKSAVYAAKVALTGVVDVANGPISPAVVLRALAALVAEDAIERGAPDAVAEFVADLEALAATGELARK